MGIIGAFIKLVSKDDDSERKPPVKISIGMGLPGGHPNSPSDGHFKIPHLSA